MPLRPTQVNSTWAQMPLRNRARSSSVPASEPALQQRILACAEPGALGAHTRVLAAWDSQMMQPSSHVLVLFWGPSQVQHVVAPASSHRTGWHTLTSSSAAAPQYAPDQDLAQVAGEAVALKLLGAGQLHHEHSLSSRQGQAAPHTASS